MKQNIYDDQIFFEGYEKLRENEDNANNIIEKPCIFSLLPPLKGKIILDMGCGWGENCKQFINLGASFVLGIDISEKMLDKAINENNDNAIKYANLPMEEIGSINNKFDIIVSSLAVHYVCDFYKLLKDVYSLLNDDGIFIFSQEHPLTTAPMNGMKWIRNHDGNIDHYSLSDYSLSGKRNVFLFGNNVIKYHRTFSDIIQNLIDTGFCINNVVEPIPSDDVINRLPKYKNDLHKPDFLVIKATKTCVK